MMRSFFILSFLLLVFVAVSAHAQDAQQDNVSEPLLQSEEEFIPPIFEEEISITSLRSVLFLPRDHQRMIQILNRLRLAKLNGQTLSPQDLGFVTEGSEDVIPQNYIRFVRLGGIGYAAPGQWVIWLNGQRLEPGDRPSEVLDLSVFKDYVEIKWYDARTNQIIPIRLRAHQAFDVETRAFLPAG